MHYKTTLYIIVAIVATHFLVGIIWLFIKLRKPKK